MKYETMILITEENGELTFDALSKQPDMVSLPNAIAGFCRANLQYIVAQAKQSMAPKHGAEDAKIVEPSGELKLLNAQGSGLLEK